MRLFHLLETQYTKKNSKSQHFTTFFTTQHINNTNSSQNSLLKRRRAALVDIPRKHQLQREMVGSWSQAKTNAAFHTELLARVVTDDE